MEFVDTDYKLIIKLEGYFIKLYNSYNTEKDKVPNGKWNEHVCCTNEERYNIKRYANIIKSLPAYSTMRLVDIYIVLIFIYYSLKYNEQTTDWLELTDLKYFVKNLDKDGNLDGNRKSIWPSSWQKSGGYVKRALALYHDIAEQDIPYIDISERQSNLSSEIRRQVLEIAEGRKVKPRRVRPRRVRTRRVRPRRVRTSRK